jgi:uncharacterized phage protein gp47/JayE
MSLDFPSRLDFHALGRDVVIQKAKRIDPVQVDVEGTDVNIYVGVAAVMAFNVILQLVYSINRLLLDGCEGEDLDRYGLDRYKLSRKGASPAVGQARFWRKSTLGGGGDIPVGTKLVTLTGIEYLTTTTAIFSASSLVAYANIRAVQAGKSTQVGKNNVRRFQDLTSIFDQTIQLNNDSATAGGEDSEEDDVYRERIREFWTSARRGTLGAIEFGAKTVEGVYSAQAVEALTPANQPARVVNLYVADSSGVSSAALGAAVNITLDEWRAGGIAVLTSSSVPQLISIALKLVFKGGTNTSALTENIRAAVFEYVNSLTVNAPLYRSELMSILQRFRLDGLVVNNDTVAEPTGDLVPNAGRTIRILMSGIEVSLCPVR